MTEFTERVIAIIKSVPAGKVVTYGQVAAMAGSPRGARQVVRVLHALSMKHGLPWHRVINAKGEIGFPDSESREIQMMSLESEGIEVRNGKIDLAVYQLQAENLAE